MEIKNSLHSLTKINLKYLCSKKKELYLQFKNLTYN